MTGDVSGDSGGGRRQERLRHVVDHVAHLLPAQGPIGVFIHHNTLHAFQHLKFEQAVIEASRIFQTEPYMGESAYHTELARGRILAEDVDAVLQWESDAEVLPRLYRRSLWRAMLLEKVRQFDPAGIRWRIEEGDIARQIEDVELCDLLTACLSRTPAPVVVPSSRGRDAVAACIHPWLIRLCSVYLDQGMSYWPMPERDRGFYGTVRHLLSAGGGLFSRELRGLDDEFRWQESNGLDAAEAVLACLDRDGLSEEEWEPALRAELLAMPGWPGLMRQLEQDPGLAPHLTLPCSLMDFLAVRLTFRLIALRHVPAETLEPAPDPDAVRLARAAALFEAARSVALSAAEVRSLSTAHWDRFVEEVEAFDSIERRRVYHAAYERRHEQEILQGLASYRSRVGLAKPRVPPAAQVFFCIDEREESMRRALEEVDPLVETFAAAGFFGVAVDYKGIDDARGAALCPIVVKPKHAVEERPLQEDRHLHESRVFRRRLWSLLTRGAYISSRTLVRGWMSTAALGLLTAVPLIGRVLAPRRFAQLRETLNRAFFPEPRTELTLMRRDTESHQRVEGLLLGFSIAEKADRVASVLGPAGLTTGFARLVVVLGHGSTSLNNPHESAYDCGACGGRRGGPNARLFASMANNPQVRRLLVERGYQLTDATWFVGGSHDTCSDDLELIDEDSVPLTHRDELERLKRSFEQARARNAHERTRRFESRPHDTSVERALQHVEERSEHLAQPRAECGHATNAVCVVGRRALTRGLFLDRRAFLVSYDATQDPTDDSLARLLAAVVPVCAGISLEYYFSFVDNERYGCGTKLPHNVTGLVGVMNGNASDLRTGLPWQMVEIHEPVRILFVMETTPERLEKVVRANPSVAEFVLNRWIRVATIDPESGQVHIRRDDGYEALKSDGQVLPEARSSSAWYEGKMQHLPMAWIQSELGLRK
jgi:uncharacterized protein YbcC (UPF0753/DUF2309 family)